MSAEPTKLMSAEELNSSADKLAREKARAGTHKSGVELAIRSAYAAALAALHEAEESEEESTRLLFVAADERDAALKRVAELEALVRHWEWANAEQDKREDALAAELSELRAALAKLFYNLDHSDCDSIFDGGLEEILRAAVADEVEPEEAGSPFGKLLGFVRSDGARPQGERERDALAAELSELRAASRAVLEPVHSTVTDEERLRKLLAQPQGERGKALLDEHAAMRKALESVEGALRLETPTLFHQSISNIIRAAIDGEQEASS